MGNILQNNNKSNVYFKLSITSEVKEMLAKIKEIRDGKQCTGMYGWFGKKRLILKYIRVQYEHACAT